jgi:hypothetical protein
VKLSRAPLISAALNRHGAQLGSLESPMAIGPEAPWIGATVTRAAAAASGLSEQEIESRVMVRASRREVLTRRNNPVKFDALICAVALRESIGSTDVMTEQLRSLVDMAKRRSNVTIRVVPLGVGWHPGFAGPFVLYDFPDAPPVVHFEHYSSGAFVPDADDVQAYRGAVDRLREIAMSPAASTRLIAQVANEMEHSRDERHALAQE